MDTDQVLEPVRFLADAPMLSGSRPEPLPQDSVVIRDLAEAMLLETEQDPPQRYRIWHDSLEHRLAAFWLSNQRALLRSSGDNVLLYLKRCFRRRSK